MFYDLEHVYLGRVTIEGKVRGSCKERSNLPLVLRSDLAIKTVLEEETKKALRQLPSK